MFDSFSRELSYFYILNFLFTRPLIQQKVKEYINKTVNSGLFVLLDSSIE